jgi:hypothetical protein
VGRAALAGLLLLHLPSASAQPLTGTLDLRGPLALPGGTADLYPLSSLLNDTTGLQSLTLETPLLRVTRYEYRILSVNAGPAPIQQTAEVHVSTYTLHDAHALLLSAQPEGWLGLYPQPSARLTLTPLGAYAIEPALSTETRNADGTTEHDPQPHVPAYARSDLGPHLRLTTAGTATFDGPHAMKMLGPDLIIHSAENTTTETTTRARTDAPATDSPLRWLFLEWDTGTLSFHTAAGLATTASSAALIWDGPAAFRVDHDTGLLDGTFHGTLTPSRTSAGPTAQLDFQGDATRTTLHHAALTTTPTSTVPPALLLGLGGALLLGLVATLAFRQRGALTERTLSRVYRLSGEPAFVLARLFALAGKDDHAERALLRALAQNSTWAIAARNHPDLQRLLHERPGLARRVQAALARAGARP